MKNGKDNNNLLMMRKCQEPAMYAFMAYEI